MRRATVVHSISPTVCGRPQGPVGLGQGLADIRQRHAREDPQPAAAGRGHVLEFVIAVPGDGRAHGSGQGVYVGRGDRQHLQPDPGGVHQPEPVLDPGQRLRHGQRHGPVLEHHDPAVVADIVREAAARPAARIEVGLRVVVGMNIYQASIGDHDKLAVTAAERGVVVIRLLKVLPQAVGAVRYIKWQAVLPATRRRGSQVDYLSKSDVVAQGIRELIHSGDLAPGDVLRQRDLAKRFQVSPTPVREALRKLEAEGFIATELHRGAVVVRSEDARLFENFLIRANLESLAAGLAAQKITPEDLEEITQLFDELSQLDPDDQRRTSLNRRFHFRIYEAARSPTLLSLLNLLWCALDGGPRVARPQQVSDQHHLALLQALRREDSNAAAEFTRLHIMEGANHIVLDEANEAAGEPVAAAPGA